MADDKTTETDDVPEPTSDESFARAIDELASLGRLSDASRDFIDGLLPKEPDDEDEDEDEDKSPPVRKSVQKSTAKPATGGNSK